MCLLPGLLDIDNAKYNVNGGSIAIGHPFGMTGSRMVGRVLRELKRTGGRYGVVTMCVAGARALPVGRGLLKPVRTQTKKAPLAPFLLVFIGYADESEMAGSCLVSGIRSFTAWPVSAKPSRHPLGCGTRL